jgi:WS/DGAT/MGAT family acyltransferase
LGASKLTSLDASFLDVESPTAHMHVGWVALFSPPEDDAAPTFEELRNHVAERLGRAPRYRQRLARVPLGLADPYWVDDAAFDIRRHVLHAPSPDLGEIVDMAMSAPLSQERPLWELWIDDELPGGAIGIVGKAHHCMVDGLAAVELASLLLDPVPHPPALRPDGWRPAPPPGGLDLVMRGLGTTLRTELELARLPLAVARSPRRAFGYADRARRAATALAHSLTPVAPPTPLNEPISSLRHLATASRPLEDFKRVGRRFGIPVNDVLLAAVAGGMRSFMVDRHQDPVPLKTMVPVSVRDPGDELGNRISFMFVELPCDEPDPLRRLLDVHLATSRRKDDGDPEGADAALRAFSYAPRAIKGAISRLAASPRTFNLTVSNIPGPREPLFMRGCELQAAYPVVPIAEGHAVSIGMTTIKDGAFIGVYADRCALPDADELAHEIDVELDELLEAAGVSAQETYA